MGKGRLRLRIDNREHIAAENSTNPQAVAFDRNHTVSLTKDGWPSHNCLDAKLEAGDLHRVSLVVVVIAKVVIAKT